MTPPKNGRLKTIIMVICAIITGVSVMWSLTTGAKITALEKTDAALTIRCDKQDANETEIIQRLARIEALLERRDDR